MEIQDNGYPLHARNRLMHQTDKTPFGMSLSKVSADAETAVQQAHRECNWFAET